MIFWLIVVYILGILTGIGILTEIYKYMCREGKMVFKHRGKWIGIEYLVKKLNRNLFSE
jgi:hypothetical protein